MNGNFPYHYEANASFDATPEQLFAFADDHEQFSSHMNQSSVMMAGSKMETHVDEGRGQQVGSHISMHGSMMGISLCLDEVVTRREPPFVKVWETVGQPKLIIMKNYRMGFEITPEGETSRLKIFIDYDRPAGAGWLLGFLLGGIYARWCVDQMMASVKQAQLAPAGVIAQEQSAR